MKFIQRMKSFFSKTIESIIENKMYPSIDQAKLFFSTIFGIDRYIKFVSIY